MKRVYLGVLPSQMLNAVLGLDTVHLEYVRHSMHTTADLKFTTPGRATTAFRKLTEPHSTGWHTFFVESVELMTREVQQPPKLGRQKYEDE